MQMNQALYRKYRSRSFKEVVGQEHVTKTLDQAIRSGRISHAYLFTGPRGVGKTSVARILAHEVNGFPYKGESINLDIIEIDAASNRRIDEIRDLRERVRIAPAAGKYKVYIIDEVHMLTREAFNALLKTLEEPPQHVIFILATTEAHKLPETIISRTQRFEFKTVPPKKSVRHLEYIAKKEGINIQPEALYLLAEFGQGSFRDSISYLDQLSSSGHEISEEDVRKMLGLPSEKEVNKIIQSIYGSDSEGIIKSVQALKEQGVDAAAAAGALAKQLREELIAGNDPAVTARLLRQLIDVPASANPYDFLEISLLEAAGPKSNNAAQSLPNKKGGASKAKPAQPAQVAETTFKTESFKKLSGEEFSLESWDEIVNSAQLKAASIYTALRLASPKIENGSLVLRFKFPLHQKKANQPRNKELILKLVEDITGHRVQLINVVDKEAFTTIPPTIDPGTSSSESLSSINNIFGAAEVL